MYFVNFVFIIYIFRVETAVLWLINSHFLEFGKFGANVMQSCQGCLCLNGIFFFFCFIIFFLLFLLLYFLLFFFSCDYDNYAPY